MVIDAQHMLAQHARGDSLRQIGHNHGISHETVRKVVIERGQSLLPRPHPRPVRGGGGRGAVADHPHPVRQLPEAD